MAAFALLPPSASIAAINARQQADPGTRQPAHPVRAAHPLPAAERSGGRAAAVVAGCLAAHFVGGGARRGRRRCRSGLASRQASASAAPPRSSSAKEDSSDLLGAVVGVAVSLFLALFDIFKAPPTEPTGKDAPGLLALGPGGVVGVLRQCKVQAASDGSEQDAGELALAPIGGMPWDALLRPPRTVLFFLTHFGDFNSWEVAQQVRTALREGRFGRARVVLIGIGSVESARKFAEFLELPASVGLFADPQGRCAQALGFSQGALPKYAKLLNPYFRVFLMLLGVGSPGTIATVLGGYFGNSNLSRDETAWVDEALKQGARKGRFPTEVPQRLPWEASKPGAAEWANLGDAGSKVWDGRGFGETGLRPFELATVRLQNMVSGIIEHWDELKPVDDELLVQLGGAVVLDEKGNTTYYYRDKGILTYAPMKDVIGQATQA